MESIDIVGIVGVVYIYNMFICLYVYMFILIHVIWQQRFVTIVYYCWVGDFPIFFWLVATVPLIELIVSHR